MSFSYDTMSKAWATLREQLPAQTKESELVMRFEFLIEEMHEANHRLQDAINKDNRVSRTAARLDEVLTQFKAVPVRQPDDQQRD